MHYAHLRNGVFSPAASAAAPPIETLLAALGSDAKGVWTDPDNTTTLVSGGVSVWADQTGTGNLTCAAARPTVTAAAGRSWVTWDATNAVLARASLGVGPDFDLFVRLRYGTPVAAYALFCGFGGANAWAVLSQQGGANQAVRALRLGAGTSDNVAPTLAEDTTAVLHVAGAGNTTWAAAWAGTIAKDGGAATAATLGYAEGDSIRLGPNQLGQIDQPGSLLVSDLVLCDPLDAAQRQAVLDYLAAI